MRWTVTDDIYAETWRQLLEFSNLELTSDVINQKQGLSSAKKDKENIKKQAAQARACVLQAKEYFDAARSSSLITSPNHSYYGAIALASLMMLIIGDGTKSLDYLRKDNKNSHHGLLFTTGCNPTSAATGLSLVENSRAEILEFGHFANIYKTLPPYGTTSAIYTNYLSPDSKYISMQEVGIYKVPTFSDLMGTKKSLIDLMKYLPDLSSELRPTGANVVQSRATMRVEKTANEQIIYTWIIHGCQSAADFEELLNQFSTKPEFSDGFQFEGPENAKSGMVTFRFDEKNNPNLKWPNSRDTQNHDRILYAQMPETHELVDLYLIAYQLSMLSRYFPDIWFKCIESQCKSARLIEKSSEIILKKFPILTLSVLRNEETVISTHKEPWKD